MFNNQNKRVKKGSKRYLKAIVISIMAWFKVRRLLPLKKYQTRN